MKVLQLGKFYPILGGVEKVEYELTTGLSEEGVRCDMMCASLNGGSGHVSLNPYSDLILCKSLFKLFATTISPAMTLALRKICNEYDIIHIHHPDPMAALSLRMSGYKGKVVLHWHSDILKQRALLQFYRPLQRWLIRRADKIVGTTRYYLENSPYLKGFEDKFEDVPIGINPIEIQTKAAESFRLMYGGRKIVFSLGRLVTYKGYHHLIEAAKYLPDDYVVLIGGSGPLEADLNETIELHGLTDKVFMLGRLGEGDVPGYFGACNVFCLSSVMKTEAFGIVQLEAMSCSKPVVATVIPGSGVSKVNEHGVSGLNVEPGNAKAIADAILSINSDEQTYSRYCKGSRQRYENYFTKRRMIDLSIALYRKLMGINSLDCSNQSNKESN